MTTKKTDRRKNAKPPAVRGVRGRKIVDQQAGFREYLRSLFTERPRLTLDEMLEKIKATGFYISRSTLAREGLDFAMQQEKVRHIVELAAQLATDDDELLTLEKATSQLAVTKLFDDLLVHSGKIDDELLDKFKVIARLQTSAATRERVRLAHNRGVKKAAEQIKRDTQALLKNKYPEIQRALMKVIDEASTKILEEGSR